MAVYGHNYMGVDVAHGNGYYAYYDYRTGQVQYVAYPSMSADSWSFSDMPPKESQADKIVKLQKELATKLKEAEEKEKKDKKDLKELIAYYYNNGAERKHATVA